MQDYIVREDIEDISRSWQFKRLFLGRRRNEFSNCDKAQLLEGQPLVAREEVVVVGDQIILVRYQRAGGDILAEGGVLQLIHGDLL